MNPDELPTTAEERRDWLAWFRSFFGEDERLWLECFPEIAALAVLQREQDRIEEEIQAVIKGFSQDSPS
jgi:hypothetical protein